MEMSKIEIAALMKIALSMTAIAPKLDSHGRREWMALLSVLNDVIARAQKESAPLPGRA